METIKTALSADGLGGMSFEEKSTALAVSILLDRIGRLSANAQNDLFLLMKDLVANKNGDERQAIADTILEIIDNHPVTSKNLDLADHDNCEPPLSKWIDWVSSKLRESREQANLTQEKLSELTGLPQSHISRIENGKLSPSRQTIEKICNALGISASQFDIC